MRMLKRRTAASTHSPVKAGTPLEAGTCYCTAPIPPDGNSIDYCSSACQARWVVQGFDREPLPARLEWRHTNNWTTG
jgi:hypothetical protein